MLDQSITMNRDTNSRVLFISNGNKGNMTRWQVVRQKKSPKFLNETCKCDSWDERVTFVRRQHPPHLEQSLFHRLYLAYKSGYI